MPRQPERALADEHDVSADLDDLEPISASAGARVEDVLADSDEVIVAGSTRRALQSEIRRRVLVQLGLLWAAHAGDRTQAAHDVPYVRC